MIKQLKLLLAIVMLLLFASCSETSTKSSDQELAEKAVINFMQKNMAPEADYKPISFADLEIFDVREGLIVGNNSDKSIKFSILHTFSSINTNHKLVTRVNRYYLNYPISKVVSLDAVY